MERQHAPCARATSAPCHCEGWSLHRTVANQSWGVSWQCSGVVRVVTSLALDGVEVADAMMWIPGTFAPTRSDVGIASTERSMRWLELGQSTSGCTCPHVAQCLIVRELPKRKRHRRVTAVSNGQPEALWINPPGAVNHGS